ncbi:hypothetical protein ACIRL0_21730 [Streptomyces sp. NPDC102365]|uniref:hypothetical protein n=1 Tax=Streptomyces sp. NPDC102365 TaxID=3366162 RepID=UPI0038271E94
MGPGHGRSKGPQRRPAALRGVADGDTGLAPVVGGSLRGVAAGGTELGAVGGGPLPYGATSRPGLTRTGALT